MKQPIRYFSIGLIVASLALFVVYKFIDKPQENVDSVEIETLISTINDHGYHVMEESEYIRLSVLQDSMDDEDEDNNKKDDDKKKDTDKEKEDKDTDKKEEKDKDKEDENKDKDDDKEKDEKEESTVKYSIKIDPDMLPTDVSNLLEEKNIIKDASKFNTFLEDNDYSQLIQIGTFDVSSDMSQEEVAKVITRSN